ncbi:trypsin-like serine protease [uncultured Corynebacterium sp.]|uniref:trypsin-like serine protease n=1 Tax=uncultured Corynebacterium sp. TaxID=159447 RepID=UPI00260042F9|nr:trypsin-like serine protease [uncultured Corynebacterium sp.]
MLRRLTTSVIAAAALVGVAVAPANALIFGTNDGPVEERESVVRIHLLADGGIAECTGTAVAPQWVLTAQHCIEGLAKDEEGRIAGSVTVGEGALGSESVRTYEVNAAENALTTNPANGDVALLHVTKDMELGAYPAVNFGAVEPGTVANAYGWSTLGSGATGVLPRTEVTIQGQEQHPIYQESQAYLTNSARPAQLQQGDSGGPIFANDQVQGVLSVGIGSIFNPVMFSATYMHAKTEGLGDWFNTVINTNPDAPAGELPEVPAGGIGSLIPQLPIVPGSADIADMVPAGSL